MPLLTGLEDKATLEGEGKDEEFEPWPSSVQAKEMSMCTYLRFGQGETVAGCQHCSNMCQVPVEKLFVYRIQARYERWPSERHILSYKPTKYWHVEGYFQGHLKHERCGRIFSGASQA